MIDVLWPYHVCLPSCVSVLLSFPASFLRVSAIAFYFLRGSCCWVFLLHFYFFVFGVYLGSRWCCSSFRFCAVGEFVVFEVLNWEDRCRMPRMKVKEQNDV